MIIAYTDTFSGISGDMFLGALIDAGLPFDKLKNELAALPLDGYRITADKTAENGLSATRINISVNHDLHHRSWRTIRKLLEESGLGERIREKALDIFSKLAEAEAKVHGCAPDEVHFHEVGGVDSIIDITGAAIGIDYFGIDHLISSPLPLSHGWVQCAHGRLPLPAPAVCELVKEMDVYGVDLKQELVTPTGAAIMKSCCRGFGPFPPMRIMQVGYGAGMRKIDDGRPNLLRLVIGESFAAKEAQEVEVIETHLDDWQPEGYPYLSELLFAKGALDAAIIPIQMKKGRPGFLLRVVAEPALSWELQRIILDETSAIGLRFRKESRWTLPRQSGFIATPLGPVAVKKVTTPSGKEVLYPEYEDCRKVASEKKIPLREIYGMVGGAHPDSFQEKK
ncbi:MAG: nickel pincer cofactor biosynthesis protein LarC [Pseudomonadota bacterium]